MRLFGAQILGRAIVSPRARIEIPWNLHIEQSGTIGDAAYIYNLAPVSIGAGATVAQEVFVCTGTHDLSDPNLPLQVAPINIGAHAFIGARAFILPGVNVGEGAVIGACAVLTRDAAPWNIYGGNPAKQLRARTLSRPIEIQDYL